MDGDPGVVGRTIVLDSVPHRVVGVMPEHFRYPTVAITHVWVPLASDMTALGLPARQIVPLVRVADGRLSGARERIEALAATMRGDGPLGADEPNWVPVFRPLNEPSLSRDVRQALLVTFGAVAIMLLVAMVNAVNLMLVRGTARVREIGVRLALGGGRARVAAQLVSEAFVLAVLGGAAALFMALGGVELLLAIAPSELTIFAGRDLRVDERVLAFAGALSFVVALGVGVLPAVHSVRAAEATASGSIAGATAPGRHRARAPLVVLQVALSLTLLFGAGLLGRSFAKLVATDPGFEAEGLASLALTLSVRAIATSTSGPRWPGPSRNGSARFPECDRRPTRGRCCPARG